MFGSFIQTAYAATIASPSNGSSATFDSLFQKINTQIISPLIYLLAALAVLYFLWGVFTFIKNADSPEDRATGFRHMIWGIIGLAIMFSAKGLIYTILAIIGLK